MNLDVKCQFRGRLTACREKRTVFRILPVAFFWTKAPTRPDPVPIHMYTGASIDPLVRCKFESGRKCNHQLRKPSCITDHSIAISGQNLLPSPTTIFLASLSKNLTDNAYGLDAHGCIEITLCDQLWEFIDKGNLDCSFVFTYHAMAKRNG